MIANKAKQKENASVNYKDQRIYDHQESFNAQCFFISNKKAVLSEGNRAMPHLFLSV